MLDTPYPAQANIDFPFTSTIIDCDRLPYLRPAKTPPPPLHDTSVGKVRAMNTDKLVEWLVKYDEMPLGWAEEVRIRSLAYRSLPGGLDKLIISGEGVQLG